MFAPCGTNAREVDAHVTVICIGVYNPDVRPLATRFMKLIRVSTIATPFVHLDVAATSLGGTRPAMNECAHGISITSAEAGSPVETLA